MDLTFLEDTKCDKRKKCCNGSNIFPIYTVAFSYSEIYNKTVVSEDSEDLEFPINNESASSTTLKNKRSIEATKFNIKNAINITERPEIPVNNITDVTEGLFIPVNNAIDYFVNLEYEINNDPVRSELLPSLMKCIKQPQKTKQRALLSTLEMKPKKCARLVKVKNIYFKNKNPKNNMNKKLETYYDRAKTKCSRKIIRKIYSDSILSAVSLNRILKKKIFKENRIHDVNKIILNGNHNEDNISYVSECSQHTLTNERSISSDNSDFSNTKTTPSVIDVSNCISIKNINSDETNKDNKLISNKIGTGIDKIENPYKTDIIAVAVARIENASILKYKKESCDRKDRKNFITNDSLTSAESYISQTATETSSTTSFQLSHNLGKEDHLTTIDINDSGVSSQTLTESENVFNITSESDQFVIAKTSSYFRNDPIDSNITLTPMISLNNKSEMQQSKFSPPKLLKSTLLDTIINVSMFPKNTTSVQGNVFNSELKDVIITEELRNSLPLNRLDNDCTNENKYSKSIFKKSYNAEDDSNRQKSINLPNEETIKELLLNRDQAHKKSCSEEFRNYTPFTELWDKLTIFLDLAMKKLEGAITEKVTQEMKKILDRLDKYINTSIGNSEVSKSETYLKRKSQDANIISKMESGETKSLQCGSIENNVLDELVKKINLKGLKTFKSPPLKLKEKSNNGDDFFEVLKPLPRVSSDLGNGESILVSSSEGMEVKYNNLQHLPLFLITIIRFVKENLLVITSVPLFCFAMFLIYTFLSKIPNI